MKKARCASCGPEFRWLLSEVLGQLGESEQCLYAACEVEVSHWIARAGAL